MGTVRVLLVRAGTNVPHYPVYTPPLGIMSLSSYLKQTNGREVRLIDQRVEEMSAADVAREALAYKPDVLGLSSMTCDSRQAYEIATGFRKGGGGGVVLLGGPHASVKTEECLDGKGIDAVVIGEGEVTLEQIVQRASNGETWDDVPGICRKDNGEVIHNPAQPFIDDLDSLPFPDREGINQERYFLKLSFASMGKRPYTPIFTSRSCPYKCIYCHKVFGKGFRAMSPERVLREIDHIVETYGIRDIEIIDDCFNFKRDRAEAVFKGIIDRKYDLRISFPNGIRGDIVTEEMFPLMYRAGVRYIAWAVESGSERIQKLIHKHIKLDKLRHAIEAGSRYGIWGHGFFMFGFPTETREDLLATLRYAVDSKLNSASFFLVNPFEGTELYDMFKERLGEVNTDEYFDYQVAPFNLTEVSTEELAAIKRRANRSFYMKPSRALRILRQHPSKVDLARYFLMFLRRAK